jgi:D-threo-aldose 1-dehydrogenase
VSQQHDVTAMLGLGCATIGGLHGPVAAEDAAETLQAAWELGIRSFDVAPLYGAGEGELRLGRFLREHACTEYTVSTKVGWRVQDGRCVIDYSYDGVRRSFEDSLSRLGLDRVDAALIHDLDPYNHGAALPARFAEAMQGAVPALLALQREGRVGAIGVAVNDPAICIAALDHADLDRFLIAGRYTLVDQAAADVLLPLCLERGARVMVGAPFNTGVLASGIRPEARFRHGPVPPAVWDRVLALEQICARFGVALPQAALQFPARHPAVSLVLPGPRSAAQLRNCVAWMNTPIPEPFWQALAAAGLSNNVAAPIGSEWK